MTGDHGMIIPLMAAALIADASSKLLSRRGLYHALAETFLRETPAARSPSAEALAGAALASDLHEDGA
jgi:H+/Cl- antiporter ClcA